MFDILVNLFPYAMAFTMPILVTALGGLCSERSGIVNIGLEGLMVVGSFSAAVFISRFYPILGGNALWFGLLVAMAAGAVFSLLHAFACINLRANHVISGIAINMIAAAMTVFFARTMTGSGNILLRNGLARFSVPVLAEIPLAGPLLFRQSYGTTWLILVVLVLVWFVLYYTRFGMRLWAAGEHPHALDAAGVSVYRIQYSGVLLSGMFAGLGGATILVTYSGEFNGSVSGMGFLALAALIFGKWKPLGVLGSTLFFGFAMTIANASQAEPALQAIPEIILKVFPYVVTLLALILFSRTTQAPRALGEPFDKGKR
ncbi:ABC transporter permease [Alkalispirochaeta alkalica]|uniref:ABC transporter permease n=1 Tax=Alkalispirochaeta alkalica TaxID=46356 RepID=UPI00036BF59E|nr:ABC transporter permease [Alkalispirochaeta alkalica]